MPIGNSKENRRLVDDFFQKSLDAIKDFERKDRLSILRKAAAPVRKTARALAPKREGNRPNPRYSKGGGIVAVYHPGNLRRSMQSLSFRKSEDIFVGPKFGKKKAKDYGRVGDPVDAYYAQMIYGSAAAFASIVLIPALEQNKAAVSRIIIEHSKTRIVQRWRSKIGV